MVILAAVEMLGRLDFNQEISNARMDVSSHLESPLPPFKGASLNSVERVAQLNASIATLDEAQCSDSIFAGDFNWDNSVDGDLDEMFRDNGWKDLWLRCVVAVGTYRLQVEAREEIWIYLYVP